MNENKKRPGQRPLLLVVLSVAAIALLYSLLNGLNILPDQNEGSGQEQVPAVQSTPPSPPDSPPQDGPAATPDAPPELTPPPPPTTDPPQETPPPPPSN